MKQQPTNENQLQQTTFDLVAKTRSDVERIAAILAQEEERKQRKRAAREARRARAAGERDGAGRDEKVGGEGEKSVSPRGEESVKEPEGQKTA